jgi:hypothetical protein
MHPKNSHRRESIASKNYVEMITEQQASEYIAKILETNLKNEFATRETQLRGQFQQAASSKSATLFLETPDVYLAAAVMIQEGFSIGRGDTAPIYRGIIKSG